MVAFQNLGGILHIKIIRRHNAPRQVDDPIYVGADDAHFGGHRRHLIQPLDLF